MRAVAVSEYHAEARLGEHEKPTAGRGQILVKVQAAGMNPMDTAIANRAFSESLPATFPLILGADVAGVVEAVGDGTDRYAIGDRVFGQLLGPPLGASGAHAEYAAIATDATVATVPDTLSSEVAAALPTPGATALQLARSVELSAAKTVVVVGAGGVVGGFLTQLLVAGGAYVLAVVLPPQSDRVRGYGAQEVIDATAEPTDLIRRLAPNGVDALVDMVSDPEKFASLAGTVRSGGTAISTRYVADVEGLVEKDIQGVNFAVGMTTDDLEIPAGLAASGQLTPPPIRTVSLDEVPDLLNARGNGFDGKSSSDRDLRRRSYADTVWLTSLDEMFALLDRAGFAVTWQLEVTEAHSANAASLIQAFTEDRQAIAAAIGAEAIDRLIAGHQLWHEWLDQGRARKFDLVCMR